jgi:hypothetical protein
VRRHRMTTKVIDIEQEHHISQLSFTPRMEDRSGKQVYHFTLRRTATFVTIW